MPGVRRIHDALVSGAVVRRDIRRALAQASPERLSASHDKPLPNYRGRGRGSGHAPSAWAAESGTVSTDQALQNIVLGLQVSLNL